VCIMRKNVNLRELDEFESCCEERRSVLGQDGLEARTVGIGARKKNNDNPGLNVCQMVNNKTFVSREMRVGRSNQGAVLSQRAAVEDSETFRLPQVSGNVPSVPKFPKFPSFTKFQEN